jgi:hypothetical protein
MKATPQQIWLRKVEFCVLLFLVMGVPAGVICYCGKIWFDKYQKRSAQQAVRDELFASSAGNGRKIGFWNWRQVVPERAKRQAAAVAHLRSLGASIQYHDEIAVWTDRRTYRVDSPWHKLKRDLLGVDLTTSVKSVTYWHEWIDFPIGEINENSATNLERVRHLYGIESLSIGRQNLTSHELEAIAELDSLKTLQLADPGAKNISGIQTVLSRLELRTFELRDDADYRGKWRFEPGEVLALETMPGLEELRVDIDCEKRVLIDLLSKTPNLRVLSLSANRDDDFVDQICKMESLESVKYVFSYSEEFPIQYLRRFLKLPNLKKITIAGKITEEGAEELLNHPTLRKLDFWHASLSATSLKHLASIQNLEELRIRSTRLDQARIESLAAATKLRKLVINRPYKDDQMSQQEIIDHFAKTLPGCKVEFE